MSETGGAAAPAVLRVHRAWYGWLVPLLIPGAPAVNMLTTSSTHLVFQVTARVAGAGMAVLALMTLAQLLRERRTPVLHVSRAGLRIGLEPVVDWDGLAGIELGPGGTRQFLRAGGRTVRFFPHPDVTLPRPVRGRWNLLPEITARQGPPAPGQPVTVAAAWTNVTAEQLADSAHQASGLPLHTR